MISGGFHGAGISAWLLHLIYSLAITSLRMFLSTGLNVSNYKLIVNSDVRNKKAVLTF